MFCWTTAIDKYSIKNDNNALIKKLRKYILKKDSCLPKRCSTERKTQ